MAEDDEILGKPVGSSAADGIALGRASLARADAYLEEQTRLARLQSENLIEQNAFEMSHLRWRRFIEHVRGTGYAMLVLTGFALLVAAGAAVWSAANDRGLVVESFSVPAELSDRGETGTVVAQHVLDRVATLQAAVVSVRAAGTYSNNWGDELKVQIPDTGVSLGEAYRYLAHWLGHQTHISGEVVHDGDGFTVTARVGTAPGHTYTGTSVDVLLDKVAERIFAETQPYRYGLYLYGQGRNAEGQAVLLALARSDAAPTERAWAYAGLMYGASDYRTAENYGRAAIALAPGLALVHNNLSGTANRLGHSELAYEEAAEAGRLFKNGAARDLDPQTVRTQQATTFEEADVAIGDFRSAIAELRAELTIDWGRFRGRAQGFLARDLAAAHELGAARDVLRAIDVTSTADLAVARQQMLVTNTALAQIDISAGDWTKARRDLDAGLRNNKVVAWILNAQLALAEAKTGNIAGARALAAGFPPDCYPCVASRAGIEVEARNWARAELLYAGAVRQAPSLPFAYMQWGRMLAAKGDLDGAMSKFDIANRKGPHFADPLEMWGEALMAKDRSDLALAKFEEADKYAPNWSRLHLKWGEALYWTGRRNEAKQQIAIASHLDLSSPEGNAFRLWMKQHD